MIFFIFLLAFVSVVWAMILKKQMQYWIFSYAKGVVLRKRNLHKQELTDIIFCLADHFELGFRTKNPDIQNKRLERWTGEYPNFSAIYRDADGCRPKITWFFHPDDGLLGIEELASLCRQGLGEIELHLHHDHLKPFPDTSETLTRKITDTIDKYAALGIFGIDKKDGKRKFGFIHGDWALDNSRGGKFCGINNELKILAKCGCYADFTFPAPCEAQPKKINSIYYVKDDIDKPKSYNTGFDVCVNKKQSGDLMIVEGPLGLRVKKRSFMFLPAIESSMISKTDPPTPKRVDFWVKSGICVTGRPEWIFIKLHTHGAFEPNADVLLGGAMHTMYSYLEKKYNDGKNFRLHYATAREMYNIIKAAEDGKSGDPCQFRDYILDKPLLSTAT